MRRTPPSRPDDHRKPNARARLARRGLAALGVAIALVAVVALECDFYSAFAEGGGLRLDGSALKELLASIGLNLGSVRR